MNNYSGGRKGGSQRHASKRARAPHQNDWKRVHLKQAHFMSENRRSTEFHEVIPNVSRSVLYEILRVQLRYRNICVRWVPRMLTDEHQQRKRKKHLWVG
jgi:hypothetical protein